MRTVVFQISDIGNNSISVFAMVNLFHRTHDGFYFQDDYFFQSVKTFRNGYFFMMVIN